MTHFSGAGFVGDARRVMILPSILSPWVNSYSCQTFMQSSTGCEGHLVMMFTHPLEKLISGHSVAVSLWSWTVIKRMNNQELHVT